MDIIAPIPPNGYSAAAINPAKSVDGVLQHNLLPHQFLQATVVSGGSAEAVLDFAGQKVPVHTEQALISGQKLNLQVVATDPQLKLQIVADGADAVLLRVVHIFDHHSDLGTKVAQLLQQRSLPTQATPNSQISRPTPTVATPTVATPTTATPTTATPTVATPTVATPTVATPTVATPTVATPTVATPTVVTPTVVTPTVVTPTVVTPTAPTQTPNMTPAATAPLSAATTAAIPSGQASTVPSASSPAPSPAIPGVTAGANGTATAVVVTGGGRNAVGAAPSAQGLTQPELGVEPPTTVPSSALPVAALFSAQQWQQLEQLATGLTSAMDQPDEKLLVNMARMLGLDFEFLAAQKLPDNPEATTSGLKGMLRSALDNADVPSAVHKQASSMTQHLESLQLCRLRLAQDGVLFLPLPLDFLHQGYVLFEQQAQQESADETAAPPPSYLVSINLSMAELGPIQANLLFEQQQLFVRIKCADAASATVVRQHIAELRQGLQEFNLGAVQVTTGAEDPALELLRRLQPQASTDPSLFDTRV